MTHFRHLLTICRLTRVLGMVSVVESALPYQICVLGLAFSNQYLPYSIAYSFFLFVIVCLYFLLKCCKVELSDVTVAFLLR